MYRLFPLLRKESCGDNHVERYWTASVIHWFYLRYRENLASTGDIFGSSIFTVTAAGTKHQDKVARPRKQWDAERLSAWRTPCSCLGYTVGASARDEAGIEHHDDAFRDHHCCRHWLTGNRVLEPSGVVLLSRSWMNLLQTAPTGDMC